MDVDRERLRNEYRAYDRRVDIVSSVEVWFTRVTEIKPTVAWFERYPSLKHPLDGNDAKPDFTVLFADGTGYVGELSDLALHDQSLDALCSQLARYDTLDRLPAGPPLPGGVQPTSPVTAIDHLLFVRHADAASADRRLRDAAGDAQHPFALQHPLIVLGWSFDADMAKYAFGLVAGNDRPRGHGRPTSLEGWMSDPRQYDTLTGRAAHFDKIKTQRRLMNDQVPPVYLAALLWNDVFGALSGGQGDIDVSSADLARRMRARWGRGRAVEVDPALDLLVTAKLAERTPTGWRVGHRPLGERGEDFLEQLLARLEGKPRGPATFAQPSSSLKRGVRPTPPRRRGWMSRRGRRAAGLRESPR